MGAEMVEDQKAILAQYPAISAVTDVIKAECGSATTLAHWRFGIDPKMLPRRTDQLVSGPARKERRKKKKPQPISRLGLLFQ